LASTDRVTDFFRKYRNLDDEWLPLEPNFRDLYPQRPCSTQLTGIFVLLGAAISTDTFRTRFCFPPTSSSPSRNKTGTSPWFSTNRSGTDPASDTSTTVTAPDPRPSSESVYSTGVIDPSNSGNTDSVL
jgi:hypothetical protein